MKIWFGETYLMVEGEETIYKVSTYRPGKTLKKSHAYILNDVVYPYRGKVKISKPRFHGIYKDGDEVIFVSDNEDGRFDVANVSPLDMESITSTVSKHKEQFRQPEDVEIINNNSEIYIPTVKDTDDFLKYLVKKIIIEKKINLRNYKDKFPNEYALNNMKSGLNRETKMTVTNFKSWCEILGVDFNIIISDNGTDTISPLEDDIEISSVEF